MKNMRNKNKSAPLARGHPPTRTSAPSLSYKRDCVTVHHSEYFSMLVGPPVPIGQGEVPPDPISNQVYAWTIQPGFAALFPWFSQIATRYEKYKLESLKIKYVPRVPATTRGVVVMAIDQDPNDRLPTEDDEGRIILLSHEGAVSASAWEDLVMTYPSHLLNRSELFVRSPLDQDGTVEARTADAGVLFVGIFGADPGLVFGDLLVEYTISLRLPQMLTPQESVSVSGYMYGTTETPEEPPVFEPSNPFTLRGMVTESLKTFGGAARDWALGRIQSLNWQEVDYISLLFKGSTPASGNLHFDLMASADPTDPDPALNADSLMSYLNAAAYLAVVTTNGLWSDGSRSSTHSLRDPAPSGVCFIKKRVPLIASVLTSESTGAAGPLIIPAGKAHVTLSAPPVDLLPDDQIVLLIDKPNTSYSELYQFDSVFFQISGLHPTTLRSTTVNLPSLPKSRATLRPTQVNLSTVTSNRTIRPVFKTGNDVHPNPTAKLRR